MSKLLDFVRAFVKEKHSKQKRWNGDPYFTHLEAVEGFTIDEFYKSNFPSLNPDLMLKKLRIIALSHDLAEDVDEFLNKEYEIVAIYRNADIDKELSESDWADIVDALRRLNKNRSENYLAFVIAAKEIVYARLPKIGDLRHNSSDLKHGNMRDKYLMALYILND